MFKEYYSNLPLQLSIFKKLFTPAQDARRFLSSAEKSSGFVKSQGEISLMEMGAIASQARCQQMLKPDTDADFNFHEALLSH